MAGAERASVETSLGELAYNQLRDLILSGELQPGERVTERGLHGRLGFGASPVRDALARLDSEGLVSTLPRRGYRISPLTLQSIDEVFDVWRIIGPAMVAMAFRRQGSAGMAALHASILADVEDTDTPVQAARKAWTAISRATANRHLVDTFSRLELHLARILYLTLDHLRKVPSPGHGHHDSVIETLLLTDEAQIQARTAEFIDGFRAEVLSVISQFSSVQSAELSFRAS